MIGLLARPAFSASPSAKAATSSAATFVCSKVGCAEVLPGAATFEVRKDHPYYTGLDADGKIVGWVARSTDLVDIKAYSGQPLVTLIGLGTDGIIKGAKLLQYHEPILLVGIPVQKLYDFIAHYVGLPAISKVVVGTSSQPGAIEVDVISGATVTALAQNQTILKTARNLGVATGAVSAAAANPGAFVKSDVLLSWQQMMQGGLFGRLTVRDKQMGIGDGDGVFIDIWYSIIDAPQMGRALLGDHTYASKMAELAPGEHLFLVLGNGSSSFKGSAFVRGGIFDRIRVTQGLMELSFRDTDYMNFASVAAVGAPYFKEGALFVTRGAELDPGAPYNLVFLGSRYTGAIQRKFYEFQSTHRLPSSVYKVEHNDEPIYVQAWRNRKVDAVLLLLYLLAVGGVFALRRYSTGGMKRLKVLHISLMTTGFVLIGLHMHAQPSVTQVLTLIGTVIGHASWELFVTAPLIFILWIFIALVSLTWGRGVFCGWVCPYGSMTELMNKITSKLGFPQFELPKKLTYLRYVVLFVLIGVYLWDSTTGELMAEVEPFKSTFLVLPWKRGVGYFAWWIVLFSAASVMWRPFCRFLCPLGAALALLGSFRFSGPRRRVFCSSCKICARACEPHAFREDGTIDPRECLSCMECEAVYRDEDKCPPLVKIKRIKRNPKGTEHERQQLKKMEDARKDV